MPWVTWTVPFGAGEKPWREHRPALETGWKTSKAHTLRIVVQGTKGHPMVAIDEFQVVP